MIAGWRRLTRVSVLGLLAAGLSCGQQLTRDFLDNTVIHDIRIDLDPNDWTDLKLHYEENTYYHANVASGTLAAGEVGIRSRGRGSRSPYKPNLDINVDKFVKKQKFAGLGFFILKANNQDASLMHEAVSFALYRKMGLPAPREAFARLFINGDYLGFYTIVEREDEDFLSRNLGEDNGDLFEWKPNAYYNFEDLGDDPEPYANLLDPKTNEDDPNYGKFIAMVKAINYAPDFVPAVSEYLDLKLYLTLIATEDVLAEIDGLWSSVYGTNNIYVYRFHKQNLFQFIAWDKDLTFMSTERDFLQPGVNVLARRLMAIPEYRTFYLSQIAKAAELLGGPGGWADREVNRIYGLIHDAALDDPYKNCLNGGSIAPCPAQSFEEGVKDMRAFIAERSAFVKKQLAQQNYQPPAGGPQVGAVTLPSLNGGDLAPGSIARVIGVDFGADTVASGTGSVRSAGRSFVAVEGVRAPLLSLSSTEAWVQVPWDLQTGTASIAIAAGGALSNSVTSPVVEAAPDILSVARADKSVTAPDNPVDPGETVTVYATGLGAVDGDVESGIPAPDSTLIHTLENPLVTVDGEPAEVLFAGLNPGSVGVYKINVTLPGDIPHGETITLSLSAGGKTATAEISVR